MTHHDRNEITRLMIERAIAYARSLISHQTEYLHYCYTAIQGESHLPIPTVENFLFALALLRSRNIDHLNEAKVILEKLLHYQNEEPEGFAKGNFPIYLHEYPICKDRFTGLHVGWILYSILKFYPQGLGDSLKQRMNEVLIKALKHASATYEEKPSSYHIGVKLGSLCVLGGEFLHDHILKEKGNVLLEALRQNPDFNSWYNPKAIGMILSALTVLYPKPSESPWKDFWYHFSATWHQATNSYIGPASQEYQQGFEPQVTLYDMFVGYYSGVFSTRSLKPNHSLLEAVLIHPSSDSLLILDIPDKHDGNFEGNKWTVFQGPHYSCCLMEGGRAPCKIIWGDKKWAHTLVFEGQNSRFSLKDNKITLYFDLKTAVDFEDREKSREVALYVDAHDKLNFFVEEQKASTFKLGDLIEILESDMKFAIKFELESGSGRFFGHRMLGNRSSQIYSKGIHRFDVYDWSLFLRTVERLFETTIMVEIDILEQ